MERKGITAAEVDILRYILQHQPVTVRQVADYMADQHGHARTTVLTHMERLRQRRFLTRKEIEGVNHYSGTRPAAEIFQGLVQDFVEQILGGSSSPLVAYLTERKDLSAEEIQQLEAMIAQLEKEDTR